MRIQLSHILLSSCALGLSLVSGACSITGLPGDLKMGELSAEQAIQVCENTELFQERELSAEERRLHGCNLAGTAAGIVASSIRGSYQEACEEARAECLTAEPDEQDENVEGACDSASYPDNCNATIAQYEACQHESVESVREYNASFSCAPPDETATDDDADEDSACSDYLAACYGDG